MSFQAEGLHYSYEALEVRPAFFAHLNDVNIFVEDEDKEYIYEAIFERMFSTTLNLFCIFPLGGKDAVIRKAAESGDRDENGKPNVFIVDGDFDNIWYERKTDYPGLIYLKKYNIESYFLSEESTIVFLRGKFRLRRQDVINTLEFDLWKQKYVAEMLELFILFSCMNNYFPDIPTIRAFSGKYMDEEGRIRQEKKNELIVRLSEPDCSQYLSTTESKIREVYGTLIEDQFSIICGKCIIECMCRYIKKRFRKNIDRETYKNHLISTFDISKLDFLKEFILDSVSQ